MLSADPSLDVMAAQITRGNYFSLHAKAVETGQIARVVADRVVRVLLDRSEMSKEAISVVGKPALHDPWLTWIAEMEVSRQGVRKRRCDKVDEHGPGIRVEGARFPGAKCEHRDRVVSFKDRQYSGRADFTVGMLEQEVLFFRPRQSEDG